MLYSVQCALYNVYCISILYTVKHTLYNVHCILYNLYCILIVYSWYDYDYDLRNKHPIRNILPVKVKITSHHSISFSHISISL